jgi:hypothetical protein
MTAVTAEVILDCLAGQLGDGDTTPFRLVTQLGVELIGQLDRRSLQGMSAYLTRRVEGRGLDQAERVSDAMSVGSGECSHCANSFASVSTL